MTRAALTGTRFSLTTTPRSQTSPPASVGESHKRAKIEKRPGKIPFPPRYRISTPYTGQDPPGGAVNDSAAVCGIEADQPIAASVELCIEQPLHKLRIDVLF